MNLIEVPKKTKDVKSNYINYYRKSYKDFGLDCYNCGFDWYNIGYCCDIL